MYIFPFFYNPISGFDKSMVGVIYFEGNGRNIELAYG